MFLCLVKWTLCCLRMCFTNKKYPKANRNKHHCLYLLWQWLKEDFTKQHTSSEHSSNKMVGSYGRTLLLIKRTRGFLHNDTHELFSYDPISRLDNYKSSEYYNFITSVISTVLCLYSKQFHHHTITLCHRKKVSQTHYKNGFHSAHQL